MLICAWLLLAVLYYFKINFRLDRVPYVDENSYWYVCAKQIISSPNLNPSSCPTLSAYSFGIPFIAAFPNLLFNLSLDNSIYFMPIVVIIGLALFLNSIKSKKWCFLFFLFAMVMTINRHGWLRYLHLGLVYGEGISMLFFLIATYEIVKVLKREIKVGNLFLLSFGTGLFAFTKPPSSWVSFSFLPPFIMRKYVKFRNKVTILFLFILPFLVQYLNQNINLNGNYSFISFSKYSFHNFIPMIKYLFDGYTMPLFFCFLSIGLILLSFRGKEYFAIIPVLSLVAFTFFIYASVLSNQEYESSAQYLSHGMLALYYLGGIGLEKIMNTDLKIENADDLKVITSSKFR